MIELGIGLIELRVGQIEQGTGLIELGIGLMELGIGLRINNARRTVLARVSGLVFFLPGVLSEYMYDATIHYLPKQSS